MPLPSEHRARQKTPGKFKRFRRENNKFGSGIDAIWGITSAGKVELQSVAFDKKKFSPEQAKAWLKKKKMKNSIEAAKNEENKMDKNENVYQSVTRNFRPTVRRDRMENKDFLVVPSIAIVEGVHNGSNGPLYYPESELSKTPQVWNAKPVVLYHPEINGRGVSACDPVIMSTRKIGEMMNTICENGKLKTEVWIDEQQAKKVDQRILEAVQNGEMMELSTGLFTDNEYTEGDWNGEPYVAIARNYRPDHLAILPDKIGACSIEDGAGFLRVNSENEDESELLLGEKFADDFFPFLEAAGIDTEKLSFNKLSHEGVRDQLYTLLQSKSDGAFIEAVYDDNFIYAFNGKLFLQKYELKKNVVKTSGIPEEVVRIIEYRTKKGTVIGNESNDFIRKDKEMDKTKLVNDIISNEQVQFNEDDREYLESQEIETLEKFIPKQIKKEEIVSNEQKPEKKEEVKTNEKPVTAEEYVNNAPPEIQEYLQSGLDMQKAEKARLKNIITANEQNEFTEEQLDAMKIGQLRSIAKLAVNKKEVNNPNYGGNLDVVDNTQEDIGELPVYGGVMNRKEEK